MLKNEQIHLFRAGIWKPRTRPGGFQGIGQKALPWLQKVKKETGLPVATEVANERHVYQALKYDIDVLWIGARTTANPFTVQEIADALEGKDIPVMVKNPINPDLKLWLGAIERLNMKGIKRIAAIHRGFSSFEKSLYRNPPKWNIAEELKRIAPDLPVFNDPSHICGKRELIHGISKKALEKHFDGLMIEVHPEPDKALSDARQQITPETYHEILCKLNIKEKDLKHSNSNELNDLREKIDILDEELLEIIEKRMELSRKVGEYKKSRKIPLFQKSRWDELLIRRIHAGIRKGLNEHFIRQIFDTIHSESISKQKMRNGKESTREYTNLVIK
jgi:chorismate mutase